MPHCITREEYAYDKDAQKKASDAELRSTHRAIDQATNQVQGLRTESTELKTELTDFKADFREFKTETERRFNVMDAHMDNFNACFDMIKEDFAELRSQNDRIMSRFGEFTSQFDELKIQSIQNTAMSRNSRLRNPSLPIYQLPVLDPIKGIVHPDPGLFPKNADEFYRLRHPITERQQRMLVYLASFYDIPYTHPSDSESQSGKGDGDDDDVVIKHPELTLELIEGIFWLNEDNFIQFREQARQWADEPKVPPIKRWTLVVSCLVRTTPLSKGRVYGNRE